jgi:hypothetical protein
VQVRVPHRVVCVRHVDAAGQFLLEEFSPDRRHDTDHLERRRRFSGLLLFVELHPLAERVAGGPQAPRQGLV